VIITELVLDDFQIFYGKQRLELGPGLYIVHGENGRGKSTFLNALTWVLFGEYKNRQGDVVSPSVMLNRDAAQEGKTTFSVELHLKDGGDVIRVKRSVDTGGGGALAASLSVDRNGVPLAKDDAEVLLRSLLDRDVSRFFLFDGEELRRYEELLFGQSTAAAEVRRSIEHILGLPALANAVTDLEQVAEDFAAEAVKAARTETKARQAAMRADQLKKSLSDAEDDLQRLVEQQTELNGRISDATAILQEHEASQDLIKKKVEAETKIQALKDEQTKLSEFKSEALSYVWKDILVAGVQPHKQQLEVAIADEQQRVQWRQEAAEIDKALEMGTCDHCGQAVHGKAEETLRTRLKELKAKPEPAGDLTEAMQAVTRLAGIAPSGRIAQAIGVDRQIGTNAAAMSKLQQQLVDYTKEAEGIPEEELRDATKERDQANQLLGVNGGAISDKHAAIAELKVNLKAARDEVQKASTSQQAAILRGREQLARDLAATFDKAKDHFRDAMREKVGQDASEIFAALASSEEYKGLKINENYGLTTLGPDGTPVPGRSAGQDQIVAFALIGALNRNATRRAPVIMDTPLGRLDATHKTNVLAHLAELAEQVFLLVHSGEVPNEFLVPIRGSVVAEYDLVEEGLFRTQIRKWVAP
jgi:DNA sulfur modification protein DndD